MLDPVIAEMVQTGILQFGQFKSNDGIIPFRFCAEYLPAYPQLLQALTERIAEQIAEFKIDRLVSVEDSLVFGVACAIRTEISLAYAKDGGAFPVQNLVGAYDSGHRAALLLNEFDCTVALTTFIADAHKVGLEITDIVAILAVGEVKTAGIPLYPLFRLEDVLIQLSQSGQLSTQQAQVVLSWIAERNQRQNH